MVNWKRDRERNLNGKWGAVRVGQILAKQDGDVTIAPDYSDIAWYTAKRDYSPKRRPEYVPLFAAIAWGIVAALVVVAVSAL
jgi:hypothetical protein